MWSLNFVIMSTFQFGICLQLFGTLCILPTIVNFSIFSNFCQHLATLTSFANFSKLLATIFILPCHHTVLYCHPAILSSCYFFIFSSFHCVMLSSCQFASLSICKLVTFSTCQLSSLQILELANLFWLVPTLRVCSCPCTSFANTS